MIDDAIDRLVDVFARAGLPDVLRSAPGVEETLRQISDEAAPLRVPDQLMAFWRRVDPQRVAMSPYPSLTSPSFALQSWQAHNREVGLSVPRNMFPFCYESHNFHFVELEDGVGHGGNVFYWGYGGTPWHVRHADLADYLEQLATMIELDEWEWVVNDDGYRWPCFDPRDVWQDIAEVRLTARQPLATYGLQREFDENVLHWPAHWLALTGITEAEWTPRGATTTLAALLTRAASGVEAAGTIHGVIVGLAGGQGHLATVDDGTATVKVWCPPGLSRYGPRMRTRFEFDLVVHAGLPASPDLSGLQEGIVRRALSHDLHGAADMANVLGNQICRAPRQATATALRPLS